MLYQGLEPQAEQQGSSKKGTGKSNRKGSVKIRRSTEENTTVRVAKESSICHRHRAQDSGHQHRFGKWLDPCLTDELGVAL